jgi:CRP-like cAMP-binding protein
VPPQQNLLRNRLLSRLDSKDFASLAEHLQPVDLPRGFLIVEANAIIESYYFMESGVASMVAASPDGLRAEIGLLGRDGVAPTAAILYADRVSFDIVIQVRGHGHRIASSALERALAGSINIRKVLAQFVQTLATQASYTALSNANHHVDERLARWILMCHDRVDDGKIALTHEYMAIMLAVRRPSVTTALHVLEGNGLIYADRGVITIRDRAGLESFAADAYGKPESEYARLFGPIR